MLAYFRIGAGHFSVEASYFHKVDISIIDVSISDTISNFDIWQPLQQIHFPRAVKNNFSNVNY